MEVGFQVIAQQISLLPTTKFLSSVFLVQREEKRQMHMFSKELKGLIISRASHNCELMPAIVNL